jgi:signal transduction histidine kinase
VSTPVSVLLVEDSEDDARLLIRELHRGDYEVSFERVQTAAAMSKALADKKWDLVICDYSMPHFSGMDALKLLRDTGSDIPFIFLSGTIGEDTAVAALKMGAQDYLMKNNFKRLLPAIQRELDEASRRKERKRLEEQIQQLQKFEAIGRLAGGIAHDFNNALGVILAWTQLGYDELPAGSPTRAKFQAIREQAQSTAGLTRQLLAFARRQVLQRQNLDLNDLITRTARLLQTAIGESVELKLVLALDLQTVTADPTQIDQILMNLCLNARDAMPNGGRIVIETKNMTITEEFHRIHSFGVPGEYVLISVSDTGTGMDQATRSHLFEPFFTTKELGRGTGLGLATTYGIVKQHDGFINAYSEVGKGTTFRVYLPSQAVASQARRTESSLNDLRGTETILLAEDNAALRDVARKVMEPLGYHIIAASTGQEAVQLFKANQEKIRVVVLDVIMPNMGGIEAYMQMRAIKPRLPVIFTTGHTAESASLNTLLEEGAVFLGKPHAPRELCQAIRSILDGKKGRSS